MIRLMFWPMQRGEGPEVDSIARVDFIAQVVFITQVDSNVVGQGLMHFVKAFL